MLHHQRQNPVPAQHLPINTAPPPQQKPTKPTKPSSSKRPTAQQFPAAGRFFLPAQNPRRRPTTKPARAQGTTVAITPSGRGRRRKKRSTASLAGAGAAQRRRGTIHRAHAASPITAANYMPRRIHRTPFPPRRTIHHSGRDESRPRRLLHPHRQLHATPHPVVTRHPPRRTCNRFGFDESNPYGNARTETPHAQKTDGCGMTKPARMRRKTGNNDGDTTRRGAIHRARDVSPITAANSMPRRIPS